MRSVRFPCARPRAANRPFAGLRARLTAFLFAACALFGGAAGAQTWPTKTLTIVSPFPAGGITDLLSRIVGAELSRALGQQVVVENRTGAGGAIALGSVAKAPPGTPRAIIQRLASELVRILNQPETRAKIESTGSLVRPGTPEALGKLTEDEFASFRRIATEANIRVD